MQKSVEKLELQRKTQPAEEVAKASFSHREKNRHCNQSESQNYDLKESQGEKKKKSKVMSTEIII